MSDPARRKRYDETGSYENSGLNVETEQIYLIISETLRAAIVKRSQEAPNETANVLDEMRLLIKREILDCKKAINSLNKANEELTSLQIKLRTERKENVILVAITHHVKTNKDSIAKLVKSIAYLKKAKLILNEYTHVDEIQGITSWTPGRWESE